ncbi:DUF2269 family protein [Candidatus Berkiella aquae]|uniref:DUF2269 domain-containing protein n=1 Tax=Candidatus Berkiella aquae TaxID=295108 RepID=A0A0Q9YN20_9GAMM|nr:DUF2269 domain-containing protein [Candidatus Berkiella aquae]MCS5710857.1 DUF2269 domain-containing protein [Candidatus Berkiella aquae]
MEYYLFLKFVHIITATFLFGTGIGTAFFMLMAYLSGNIATIKQTTRHVVLADWIFTTPSVILQPITGIALMWILHYPFNSLWFAIVIGLYIFTGFCWIPVVFIQYQLRNQAATLQDSTILPPRFRYLMFWWIGLGIPAFISVLLIYWLMVSKWGLSDTLFS